MKQPDIMTWKEVAWNGIRFRVPSDWEVGKIGIRYLMLENGSGPVLEIKWGPVRGHFSHQAHLRRLAGMQKKQLVKAVAETPLPPAWKEAMSAYKVFGFSWAGKNIAGRGLISYCPSCRHATLIQFYYNDFGAVDDIAQKLLASFRGPCRNEQVRWCIYDIRASIPEKFQLVRYCFEPGKFELAFSCKGHKITLYRWGPASVFLHRGLTRFAETMVRLPQGEPRDTMITGRQTVEWETPSSPARWLRFWNCLRAGSAFHRLILWHLEEKNRILAVRAEGRKPLDPCVLEKICAAYESV
jgi:hypothetical protein